MNGKKFIVGYELKNLDGNVDLWEDCRIMGMEIWEDLKWDESWRMEDMGGLKRGTLEADGGLSRAAVGVFGLSRAIC